MGGPAFIFVNGAQVDARTRRRMRSHVMKGKNAGRILRRRGATSGDQIQRHGTMPGETEPDHDAPVVQHESMSRLESAVPESPLGNVLLTTRLPRCMTAYAVQVVNTFYLYVVERLYPVKLGLTLETYKAAWLEIQFQDEAVSLSNIAAMEATIAVFKDDTQTSSPPQALSHFNTALRCVNRRLRGPEALSDSTIGAVVALILWEQVRKGDQAETRVHMKGLERMLQLRGGLSGLTSQVLALKICKMGISYSLQYGGPVLFYRDEQALVRRYLRSEMTETGLYPEQGFHTRAMDARALNDRLYRVLVDARDLSALLNRHNDTRNCNNSVIDVIVLQEIIISLSCRLVQFRPLTNTQEFEYSTTELVHHLGLTMFVMSLYLQHESRGGFVTYAPVTRALDSVLQLVFVEQRYQTDEIDPELLMWLLFIGGIWESREFGDSRLLTWINMLARQSGVESWAEARAILANLPWVHVMHDEPGEALWNRAMM